MLPPTVEIDRKSEPRVSESRTVDLHWSAFNGCMEISDRIWQQRSHVGRSAKEAERVEITEDKAVERSIRAVDRKSGIYDNSSGVKGIGDDYGVGVNGCNDISARA